MKEEVVRPMLYFPSPGTVIYGPSLVFEFALMERFPGGAVELGRRFADGGTSLHVCATAAVEVAVEEDEEDEENAEDDDTVTVVEKKEGGEAEGGTVRTRSRVVSRTFDDDAGCSQHLPVVIFGLPAGSVTITLWFTDSPDPLRVVAPPITTTIQVILPPPLSLPSTTEGTGGTEGTRGTGSPTTRENKLNKLRPLRPPAGQGEGPRPGPPSNASRTGIHDVLAKCLKSEWATMKHRRGHGGDHGGDSDSTGDTADILPGIDAVLGQRLARIIDEPDTSNENENAVRAALHGFHFPLLAMIPPDTEWWTFDVLPEQLGQLLTINATTWSTATDGTTSACIPVSANWDKMWWAHCGDGGGGGGGVSGESEEDTTLRAKLSATSSPRSRHNLTRTRTERPHEGDRRRRASDRPLYPPPRTHPDEARPTATTFDMMASAAVLSEQERSLVVMGAGWDTPWTIWDGNHRAVAFFGAQQILREARQESPLPPLPSTATHATHTAQSTPPPPPTTTTVPPDIEAQQRPPWCPHAGDGPGGLGGGLGGLGSGDLDRGGASTSSRTRMGLDIRPVTLYVGISRSWDATPADDATTAGGVPGYDHTFVCANHPAKQKRVWIDGVTYRRTRLLVRRGVTKKEGGEGRDSGDGDGDGGAVGVDDHG